VLNPNATIPTTTPLVLDTTTPQPIGGGGSMRGNDFIFAYVQNIPQSNLYVIVSNANPTTANILISSDFPTFNTFQLTVPGRSVQKVCVDINKSLTKVCVKIPIIPILIQTISIGSNLNTVIIEDKGIRLQSDQLVTVYATSGDFPRLYFVLKIITKTNCFSSDSYSILPTSLLGTRYRAVSSARTMNNFNNIVTAIAYVDNTIVRNTYYIYIDTKQLSFQDYNKQCQLHTECVSNGINCIK
jgi:hypothetical protein